MAKPKRCWGVEREKHAKGCRASRPLCRWMRCVQAAKYGVCNCAAYPFPHRTGSGLCGSQDKFNRKVTEAVRKVILLHGPRAAGFGDVTEEEALRLLEGGERVPDRKVAVR